MLDIFIVLVCLLLNAFFSAYEMAFVTVSREEIDGLNEKSGVRKKVLAFKKRPERTLSVIQIGITLVGAIAAAVGGTGAVDSLEPYIVERLGFSKTMAEALAVSVVIIPLTYFSVVFGELVPKTVALKSPVKVINFGTFTLGMIDNLLSPIVSFLEVSTSFLLKKLKLDAMGDEDESMGQIVEIGNLPDYHQQFVKNLADLKGVRASKAMVPWSKTVYLEFKNSDEEVKEKIHSVPYSRFPVIDGDVLVGILLKKHFPLNPIENPVPWQGVLHPVAKVKEDDRVLEAFLMMQKKQIPIAVVENSSHHFVGIITLEDILEEIVGDISDRADYSLTSKLLANRVKINLKK